MSGHAVLIALDGFQKYVRIPYPPPSMWKVPVQQPAVANWTENTLVFGPISERRFYLTDREHVSGYYIYRERP